MAHLFCAFLIGGALSTLFISTRSSAGNRWFLKNPSSRCRSAVRLCRWLQQQCFLHSSPVISCPISKLKPCDSACCCFLFCFSWRAWSRYIGSSNLDPLWVSLLLAPLVVSSRLDQVEKFVPFPSHYWCLGSPAKYQRAEGYSLVRRLHQH